MKFNRLRIFNGLSNVKWQMFAVNKSLIYIAFSLKIITSIRKINPFLFVIFRLQNVNKKLDDAVLAAYVFEKRKDLLT